MKAIRAQGLTKTFPGHNRILGVQEGTQSVTAIHNLDLVVETGEVFGFLGPNGAGKSTTINVLLDYVRPTAGSAEVLGMDAQEQTLAVHDRIGVLPEKLALWDRLPARDHVHLVARTKDVPVDPAAVLSRVGLDDVVDRPVGEFSTGMHQRLGLAMVLVGEPDLLILDEPTAGLDPNGVRRLRGIIDEEVDRGATVFFSSHVLDQVEAVCDRVGILRDGRLVAVDTIEGLRERVDAGDELTVQLETTSDGIAETVRAIEGVTDVTCEGPELVATCTSGAAKFDVLDVVRETDATARNFDVEAADLESLFADYAGDGAASQDSDPELGQQRDERDDGTEPVEVDP